MSAYICDKQHIIYLVDAAMSDGRGSGFRWYWGDRPNLNRGDLQHDDDARAAEVANMLWRENIASVSHRYPHETSATLPGPIDEKFVIEPGDFAGIRWLNFAAVQVIKACDCYAYQACEHDGWEASEAKAFIDSLRASYWHNLPGYDGAEWGAPAVYENAKNVVCLTDLMER